MWGGKARNEYYSNVGHHKLIRRADKVSSVRTGEAVGAAARRAPPAAAVRNSESSPACDRLRSTTPNPNYFRDSNEDIYRKSEPKLDSLVEKWL